MIPIYEQGPGKGIDHRLDSFQSRFNEICAEHIKNGRAKSFAFIFYDFTDAGIRRVLKDRGVFTKLDRLSGRNLSIFYLHAWSSEASTERFNSTFLSKLGLNETAKLPCVVFFKLDKDQFTDITVAELENANIIHAFSELYETVENYTKNTASIASKQFRYVRWIKGGSKFLSIEVLRALLKEGLSVLF